MDAKNLFLSQEKKLLPIFVCFCFDEFQNKNQSDAPTFNVKRE